MVAIAYASAAVTFALTLVTGAIWFAGILIAAALAGAHAGDTAVPLRFLGLLLLAIAPVLTLASGRALVKETRAQVRLLRRRTPATGD